MVTGLSEARLRTGDGQATLDPDRVRDVALRSLEFGVHTPLRLVGEPVVEVEGTQVTVHVEGEASYVFAPRTVHVRAVATAELQEEVEE